MRDLPRNKRLEDAHASSGDHVPSKNIESAVVHRAQELGELQTRERLGEGLLEVQIQKGLAGWGDEYHGTSAPTQEINLRRKNVDAEVAIVGVVFAGRRPCSQLFEIRRKHRAIKLLLRSGYLLGKTCVQEGRRQTRAQRVVFFSGHEYPEDAEEEEKTAKRKEMMKSLLYKYVKGVIFKEYENAVRADGGGQEIYTSGETRTVRPWIWTLRDCTMVVTKRNASTTLDPEMLVR